MRDLNEQDESALPEGIRLHKLFFAARSRFFSVTVPKLLRSGVLLESSPIAKNKRCVCCPPHPSLSSADADSLVATSSCPIFYLGSRSELRVRLGIDEEAMIQISISRKSMVLAVVRGCSDSGVRPCPCHLTHPAAHR